MAMWPRRVSSHFPPRRGPEPSFGHCPSHSLHGSLDSETGGGFIFQGACVFTFLKPCFNHFCSLPYCSSHLSEHPLSFLNDLLHHQLYRPQADNQLIRVSRTLSSQPEKCSDSWLWYLRHWRTFHHHVPATSPSISPLRMSLISLPSKLTQPWYVDCGIRVMSFCPKLNSLSPYPNFIVPPYVWWGKKQWPHSHSSISPHTYNPSATPFSITSIADLLPGTVLCTISEATIVVQYPPYPSWVMLGFSKWRPLKGFPAPSVFPSILWTTLQT